MKMNLLKMNNTLYLIATYDGWIFSASGNTAIKGRNGTTRRVTDLHYLTSWDWLLPVYVRLCSECSGEEMKVVQSAILIGDIEVAGEVCGRVIDKMLIQLKHMRNQNDEQYIIEMIREGKANKEIAQLLRISEGAVKNRVHQLFRKYNCKNRVDLAIKTLDVSRESI